MAYMFPQEIKKDINNAEAEVYHKLRLGLQEEIVCYHNYEVNNMETDFIIMLPGKGIAILEVKSWGGGRISKVLDAEHIEYFDQNNEKKIAYSPLTQCKNYIYALRDNIKSTFGKRVKVVPLVCFPFMTEAMYKQKSMHIVVPRERVILKDDLEDLSQLYYVIKQKFDAKKVGVVHPFDEDTYLEVINEWFEDRQTIIERMEKYRPTRKVKRMFHRRNYSLLSYFNINMEGPQELLDQQLDPYFEKWIVGTKIILVVNTKEQSTAVMKYLERKVEKELSYLLPYKDFKIYDTEKGTHKSTVFNFEVYYGIFEKECEAFTIIDGENYIEHHDILEVFDKRSNFNYKQYKIEHAPKEGNILVKAGAGTGKTYSMVSRIGYLYYINNYKPEDLLDAIVMITFTNEAADNMKKRLKAYFTNLAILTEETEYIHIMENISRMQISTIHSLMKKIIQLNSKYLGVGQSIKITTEKYEKQQLIHEALENLTKEDRYRPLMGDLKKYELRKAVEKFIDMLDKKNINLEYEQHFDEVSEQQCLFELILKTAIYVQKKSIEQHIKNNKVHLSNLALYVDKILRNMPEVERKEGEREVDYVFVDEFQDTDDVTIDLIRRFYNRYQFNLFVVGDIKQSIYRFRGADDEAFTKLQQGICEWIRDEVTDNPYLTLNKNYRSDSKLLECFHNLFMEWTKGIGRFDDILKYDTSDALEGVKWNEYIQQSIIPKKCTDATFEEVLIESIKSRLQDLEEKYQDKPNEKGAIAILTRSNSEIDVIRELGMKHGYTIETDKVENLYQMAPTIDLYRLVLALQYNTNPKYLYSLSLSNYAPTIARKEVYKNKENRQYIYKCFKENRIIPNWTQVVEEVQADEEDTSVMGSVRQKTILRVIREVNKATRPWERHAAQFPEETRQMYKEHYKRNQDLLMERLIQMAQGEYLTINSIAKYLHIMIFAKQHQDGRTHKKKTTTHIIKCLTVHKSKGLEYDHVIIPYTNTPLDQQHANQVIVLDGVIYTQLIVRSKDEKRGQEAIGIRSKNYFTKVGKEKKDLVKEEARILYVALTRAEDTVTWFEHIDEQGETEAGVTWTELLKKGGGCNGAEESIED